MRIVLDQRDIEKALDAYIEHLGFDLDNKSTSVDLTAGRGANGFTAEVTVEELLPTGIPEINCEEVTEKKPRKRNKPKDIESVTEEVNTPEVDSPEDVTVVDEQTTEAEDAPNIFGPG